MSEPTPQLKIRLYGDARGDAPPPRRRRRGGRWRGRTGLWLLLSLFVQILVIGFIYMAITGASVPAPEWLRDRLLAKANEALPQGRIGVRRISFRLGEALGPEVRFEGISLVSEKGLPIARVDGAEARLSREALLHGRLAVERLHLSDAEMSLRRKPDGTLDLSIGLAGGDLGATGTLAEMLEVIDRAFERPGLSDLREVVADDLTLLFDDRRTGQSWVLEDGAIRLVQNEDSVDISVAVKLAAMAANAPDHVGEGMGEKTGRGTGENAGQSLLPGPAEASFSFRAMKGSLAASFGANIEGVDARLIAGQVPALAWLSVVEAPVSGAFRASAGADGDLADLDATLQIGAGVIRPAQTQKPVRFTSGRVYLSWDPAAQKITFDEFSIATEKLSINAEGTAYLRDLENGVPRSMIGQFRLLEGRVDAGEEMEGPLLFTGGAADMRMRLDPFVLDIGQAVLEDGERRFRGEGQVRANPKGWFVDLDLAVNQITAPELLALWPKRLVPNTRKWIRNNVLAGEMTDIRAAVRVKPGDLVPGGRPALGLNFDFTGVKARFMKKMPPVEGAQGYGTISDGAFTLVMDEGHVIAPNGERIEGAGTVFRVPDIFAKPALGVVRLHTESALTAALSILDNPPFRFLTKAGLPVDLASGRAVVEGDIEVLLVKKILIDDVDFDLGARLEDVVSEKLVEGHVLRAAHLDVAAKSDDGIEISGQGTLGAVDVAGRWFQKFGPEHKGRSRVEGTLELSPDFIREFRIGLPKGSVSGKGSGRIGIDFLKGEAPRFSLTSDLRGVGLRLSDLGWRKPAGGKGSLKVSGRLGRPPVIERLVLDAAGLGATGRITLRGDGGLEEARFERVKVGGWLDAKVVLAGRGRGAAPEVRVEGGTLDLRKTRFLGGGGSSGEGGPILLNFDRVIVSEGITLTSLRGRITRNPGLGGNFTARVNGAAAINGVLAPGKGGTKVRILSKDGGGVFRAVGIIENARGGEMDLLLVPLAGKPGTYDGMLKVKNTRVFRASALTALLHAISGIGLLEQLSGGGILFSSVEARFRLTPRQVILYRSSAVGPSLGVSMDGYYDLETGRLDMQGVISPIYLVNQAGQILTRRGEGLFGFNFRLVGSADNPRVRVNPLSILTPGMFREIFRRAPPKPSN